MVARYCILGITVKLYIKLNIKNHLHAIALGEQTKTNDVPWIFMCLCNADAAHSQGVAAVLKQTNDAFKTSSK